MEGSDLASILGKVFESEAQKEADRLRAERDARTALRKQQGLDSNSKLTAGELVDRFLAGGDSKPTDSIEVPEEKPQEVQNVARPKASGFFPKPPGS